MAILCAAETCDFQGQFLASQVSSDPWLFLLVQSESVHWCSGYCTLPRQGRSTGSTPVCTAERSARGRAAQASARQAEQAGSTPAGHSDDDDGPVGNAGRPPSLRTRDGSNPLQGTERCVGWASASHDACKASAFRLCRFNSCPTRSIVRLG
jgi:hypothetical protein